MFILIVFPFQAQNELSAREKRREEARAEDAQEDGSGSDDNMGESEGAPPVEVREYAYLEGRNAEHKHCTFVPFTSVCFVTLLYFYVYFQKPKPVKASSKKQKTAVDEGRKRVKRENVIPDQTLGDTVVDLQKMSWSDDE